MRRTQLYLEEDLWNRPAHACAEPADVPTLAQLVAKITPENRYSEITTAAEVGKEVVEW